MAKILIADDEPEILDILGKKIADSGYDVITVNNGRAAWENIVQEKPDVVLLDLIMPQMNGFEVLERMKQDLPTTQGASVIIISAYGELDNLKKRIDFDAVHYLAKPCSMEDVLKAIERVLEQRT